MSEGHARSALGIDHSEADGPRNNAAKTRGRPVFAMEKTKEQNLNHSISGYMRAREGGAAA